MYDGLKKAMGIRKFSPKKRYVPPKAVANLNPPTVKRDLEAGFPEEFLLSSFEPTVRKIVALSEATMNEVKIKDKNFQLVQNAGIVQGGSDCVGKFS
jgi:hypothetical protein